VTGGSVVVVVVVVVVVLLLPLLLLLLLGAREATELLGPSALPPCPIEARAIAAPLACLSLDICDGFVLIKGVTARGIETNNGGQQQSLRAEGRSFVARRRELPQPFQG
jgi:hypothetical protein